MFYLVNHFKRAFGFFKCQVCLSRWTSALSWAKKNQAGRLGYKYGQICKSAGCEGSGHRIYVKPYELVSSRRKLRIFLYKSYKSLYDLQWYNVIIFQIFETDPSYERKSKKTKGEHKRSNCEMCNLLGGGRHCFQMDRSARYRQANEASEAYRNQPDLV